MYSSDKCDELQEPLAVDEDEGECSGQKPLKDQEDSLCNIEAMMSSDLLTTDQETIDYQEVSSPYMLYSLI